MIGFVNLRVWPSVVQFHNLFGVLLLLAPLIPPVFFGHAKTTEFVARTDVLYVFNSYFSKGYLLRHVSMSDRKGRSTFFRPYETLVVIWTKSTITSSVTPRLIALGLEGVVGRTPVTPCYARTGLT